MASPNPLVALLFQAAASPFGMILEITDPTPEGAFLRAQQALYRAKREATAGGAAPELETLQFRRSPHRPEAEVWIVKLTRPKAGENV